MKLQVFHRMEEYVVKFKRVGEHLIIDDPTEELLASLCCISQLPIDGARVAETEGLLIATTTDPEIDDTYGENEFPIEVTYNASELSQIQMLFDHEV